VQEESNPDVMRARELAGEELLPNGSEVVLTLDFLDRVLKYEVVLDNLHDLLFATSFVEIVLLGFFFIFSLRKPRELFFWAMHTPHFLHAFWGFNLLNKLPKSQELAALIKPEPGTENERAFNLTKFEADFQAKVIGYVLKQQAKMEKVLKIFTSLTIICMCCD
jgi:hypothetical protein